ncbi:MAG: trimethylamine methyltransferase family protein, partial [Thiolinea sp.]
ADSFSSIHFIRWQTTRRSSAGGFLLPDVDLRPVKIGLDENTGCSLHWMHNRHLAGGWLMGRRTGGRMARVALRRAPLAEDRRPVQAGLSGGQYQPLSATDLDLIHEAVLRILEEVGFAQATPHCIETCTAFGAVLGKDGRLRMPRAVVEKALSLCQREVTLYGQKPEYDIHLAGQKVHFATAGAAVMLADAEHDDYRDTNAQDLYDLARLTQECEYLSLFQRMCVLRDIDDNHDMDQNTLYAALMGTSKPVGSSWSVAEHLAKSFQMLHLIAGSEAAWRARPFVSQSNCFVVPPMKFAEDALDCLRLAVEGGMPVLLLSAAQAGATAPANLAGATAQAWAECLGGLVYVNAMQPGAPAILGAWPFISDLRTGAMSGGSPEQGLLSAACMQMGHYYNLPSGTACGMSDAKYPDFQAGAERAGNAMVAALSGANIVYESAGMYASLLSCSKESLLLDNDVLGSVLRVVRGIEVNEATLSVDIIKEVCCNGPGHYLGAARTLEVMQSEYIYPKFSDRDSPNEWTERGRPNLLDKAIRRKNEILANTFPDHISDEVDQAIRARFNIVLPRHAVGRS